MAHKNSLGFGDSVSLSDSSDDISASLDIDKATSHIFRPDKDVNIITLRCPKNKTPNNKYCRFTLLIPSEETDAAYDNNNNDDNNKKSRKVVEGDGGHRNKNNNNNNNNNMEVTLKDNNNNNNKIKVVKLVDTSNNVLVGNCIICYDKPIQSLYFPCGHLNSCYECALKVYLSRTKCPLCNAPVRKVMKAYFDCET